MEYQPLSTCTW